MTQLSFYFLGSLGVILGSFFLEPIEFLRGLVAVGCVRVIFFRGVVEIADTTLRRGLQGCVHGSGRVRWGVVR